MFLIKESSSNISDNEDNTGNNLVPLPNSLHNVQTKQSNGTSSIGEVNMKLRSQGQSNSWVTKTLSKFTNSKKEIMSIRKMGTSETMGKCEVVEEWGSSLDGQVRQSLTVGTGRE